MSGERPAGSGRRSGHGAWPAAVLSVLGSAASVAAVGAFCALIYPILTELGAERLTGEDGTEHRMLGFWSVLVLAVLVGCICGILSWTLTYLDSYQPGMTFPTLLAPPRLRDVSGHGFHVGHGVAALNGIMAVITVIWNLS